MDGNYCKIPTDKPVILDLAYLLSTDVTPFEIPDNVEKVFFSMSKCFGLRNYRIGYYWSKKHNVYDHKFEKSSYIIQHIEEIKTI